LAKEISDESPHAHTLETHGFPTTQKRLPSSTGKQSVFPTLSFGNLGFPNLPLRLYDARSVTIRPIKTRIFNEREDIVGFIRAHVPKLKNGSVLIVTSKIVALAEGRIAKASEQKRLIKEESDWTLKTKLGNVTLKDGILMWNAGIDSSNAKSGIILLPKDSFEAAAKVRKELLKLYKIKKLGVVITDSRIMPLRAGVVGIALGYAGFKGIKDYRGKKDIFGKKLAYTQTDIADSIATAAILTMGEGAEKRPLCIVEDAPVEFTNRLSRNELLVALRDDMYQPLFKI
jgi:coenzyme F420-0:L-glutamate ligase